MTSMENIEKIACNNLTDESYMVDKCLKGQGKFSIAGRHFPDAGAQAHKRSREHIPR